MKVEMHVPQVKGKRRGEINKEDFICLFRYHRTFSRGELGRYPKKDVATYWQCEDYPKAWGHGMRENPLPRRLTRTDPGPMRDRTVFRTATTIPRLPQSLQPVSK